MTGNEYQRLASRTINPDIHDNLEALQNHALHGMVGEIGEIHSIYQKAYQGHDIDTGHIVKELGDLLWFIAEFCTSMYVDLDDVMAINIEKLRKRYPEGFETDLSLHRSKDDI